MWDDDLEARLAQRGTAPPPALRARVLAAVQAEQSARAGRTRNVASQPPSSIRPPKYPPVAPAPTTRNRMVQSLPFVATE